MDDIKLTRFLIYENQTPEKCPILNLPDTANLQNLTISSSSLWENPMIYSLPKNPLDSKTLDPYNPFLYKNKEHFFKTFEHLMPLIQTKVDKWEENIKEYKHKQMPIDFQLFFDYPICYLISYDNKLDKLFNKSFFDALRQMFIEPFFGKAFDDINNIKYYTVNYHDDKLNLDKETKFIDNYFLKWINGLIKDKYLICDDSLNWTPKKFTINFPSNQPVHENCTLELKDQYNKEKFTFSTLTLPDMLKYFINIIYTPFYFDLDKLKYIQNEFLYICFELSKTNSVKTTSCVDTIESIFTSIYKTYNRQKDLSSNNNNREIISIKKENLQGYILCFLRGDFFDEWYKQINTDDYRFLCERLNNHHFNSDLMNWLNDNIDKGVPLNVIEYCKTQIKYYEDLCNTLIEYKVSSLTVLQFENIFNQWKLLGLGLLDVKPIFDANLLLRLPIVNIFGFGKETVSFIKSSIITPLYAFMDYILICEENQNTNTDYQNYQKRKKLIIENLKLERVDPRIMSIDVNRVYNCSDSLFFKIKKIYNVDLLHINYCLKTFKTLNSNSNIVLEYDTNKLHYIMYNKISIINNNNVETSTKTKTLSIKNNIYSYDFKFLWPYDDDDPYLDVLRNQAYDYCVLYVEDKYNKYIRIIATEKETRIKRLIIIYKKNLLVYEILNDNYVVYIEKRDELPITYKHSFYSYDVLWKKRKQAYTFSFFDNILPFFGNTLENVIPSLGSVKIPYADEIDLNVASQVKLNLFEKSINGNLAISNLYRNILYIMKNTAFKKKILCLPHLLKFTCNNNYEFENHQNDSNDIPYLMKHYYIKNGFNFRDDQKQYISTIEQNLKNQIYNYNEDNFYNIFEINMGSGKTSVITPYVLLYIMLCCSDKIRDVVVIVPDHLLDQTYDAIHKFNLNSIFAQFSLVAIQKVKLQATRDDKDLLKSLNDIYDPSTDSSFVKKLTICSSLAFKSYVLTHIEQNKELPNVCKKEKNKNVLLICDEVDSFLNELYSDLIYPVNNSHESKLNFNEGPMLSFVTDLIDVLFERKDLSVYCPFKDIKKEDVFQIIKEKLIENSNNNTDDNIVNTILQTYKFKPYIGLKNDNTIDKNKIILQNMINNLFPKALKMTYKKDYMLFKSDDEYRIVPCRFINSPMTNSEFQNAYLTVILGKIALKYDNAEQNKIVKFNMVPELSVYKISGQDIWKMFSNKIGYSGTTNIPGDDKTNIKIMSLVDNNSESGKSDTRIGILDDCKYLPLNCEKGRENLETNLNAYINQNKIDVLIDIGGFFHLNTTDDTKYKSFLQGKVNIKYFEDGDNFEFNDGFDDELKKKPLQGIFDSSQDTQDKQDTQDTQDTGEKRTVLFYPHKFTVGTDYPGIYENKRNVLITLSSKNTTTEVLQGIYRARNIEKLKHSLHCLLWENEFDENGRNAESIKTTLINNEEQRKEEQILLKTKKLNSRKSVTDLIIIGNPLLELDVQINENTVLYNVSVKKSAETSWTQVQEKEVEAEAEEEEDQEEEEEDMRNTQNWCSPLSENVLLDHYKLFATKSDVLSKQMCLIFESTDKTKIFISPILRSLLNNDKNIYDISFMDSFIKMGSFINLKNQISAFVFPVPNICLSKNVDYIGCLTSCTFKLNDVNTVVLFTSYEKFIIENYTKTENQEYIWKELKDYTTEKDEASLFVRLLLFGVSNTLEDKLLYYRLITSQFLNFKTFTNKNCTKLWNLSLFLRRHFKDRKNIKHKWISFFRNCNNAVVWYNYLEKFIKNYKNINNMESNNVEMFNELGEMLQSLNEMLDDNFNEEFSVYKKNSDWKKTKKQIFKVVKVACIVLFACLVVYMVIMHCQKIKCFRKIKFKIKFMARKSVEKLKSRFTNSAFVKTLRNIFSSSYPYWIVVIFAIFYLLFNIFKLNATINTALVVKDFVSQLQKDSKSWF